MYMTPAKYYGMKMTTNRHILINSLRYHTYAGDGRAIITTTPPPVTEITHNHKGHDVLCLTIFCLDNLQHASWYIRMSSTNGRS